MKRKWIELTGAACVCIAQALWTTRYLVEQDALWILWALINAIGATAWFYVAWMTLAEIREVRKYNAWQKQLYGGWEGK